MSNFFGTDFKCYPINYQFQKNCLHYPIYPNKNTEQINICYESNIFGLKGPRKMEAFVPKFAT